MTTKLMELDQAGLQEVTGGITWASVTPWAVFTVVVANWTDIKKGLADGWSDAGSINY